MEKSKILSADILDILFEGRNKTYGAYELRKTYNRRIAFALVITFSLCLLFLIGSTLAKGEKKKPQTELVTTVELENFKKEEPKPEISKPVPKQEISKIEMAKFTPPVIVREDVKEDDEIKEVKALEDTRIGTINQEGIKMDEVIAPPVERTGIEAPLPMVEKDIDKVYRIVQIEAQFPGGMDAWRKFLERNLNKELPSENGAPPADYTVIVSFIVDRQGNISDVKAENDPGYGTKAEAMRVIQKGPKWSPAIQNGTKVIYRQKQHITFRVAGD
jgi:protein TonB